MNRRVRVHAATVGLAAALGWCLAATAADTVTVSNAWVRGTVAVQKTTGAFMDLSASEKVALVGVTTPATATVEIHRTVVENQVARMLPVDRIEVAAKQTVSLKPGSYHLMLINPKAALKKGDSVALTLTFERADKSRISVEVKAEVREPGGAMQHNH